MNLRIGYGIDVHAFSDESGRALVLGGVTVPGSRGLAGHSDADAVSHALADALLGAADLGDLGRHFPDTDARWAGADSLVLLGEVMTMLAGIGYRVVNADCTVLLDAARLSPYTAEMGERLARVVGAPVSVKATRAEGLGAIGRSEGVVCMASVLIESDAAPDGAAERDSRGWRTEVPGDGGPAPGDETS